MWTASSNPRFGRPSTVCVLCAELLGCNIALHDIVLGVDGKS